MFDIEKLSRCLFGQMVKLLYSLLRKICPFFFLLVSNEDDDDARLLLYLSINKMVEIKPLILFFVTVFNRLINDGRIIIGKSSSSFFFFSSFSSFSFSPMQSSHLSLAATKFILFVFNKKTCFSIYSSIR